MSRWSRGAGLLAGAAGSRAAYAALRATLLADRGRWVGTNHRGEPVTLLEGPACALAAGAGVAGTPGVPPSVRAATVAAILGAGALGGYDDLAGPATIGTGGHGRARAGTGGRAAPGAENWLLAR